MTSDLCLGPETAGYRHTHLRRSFFLTEASCEHREHSESHRQPWNLQLRVVTKPGKQCVHFGRSENRIVLWRNLLFPKTFSIAVSGKRKNFQRLRVYGWKPSRLQQTSCFAQRSAASCPALKADQPVFSPGPEHVRSTNQPLIRSRLQTIHAQREAAGIRVGL